MDCENCVFFLVRNVLVYTAESQTSHSEITESISDKQNQISKAHPAVGLGAVSQHLLEANGTGESFSKNPALRPDTTDREHINKKIVQLKAAPPKRCLQLVHISFKSLRTFGISFMVYITKNIML